MSTPIIDLSQEPQPPVGDPFDTSGAYGRAFAAYGDAHRAWAQMLAAKASYIAQKTAWNADYLNHSGPPPNEPRPVVPFAINPDGTQNSAYVVCAEVPDPPLPPPNTNTISAGGYIPTPWEQQISAGLSALYSAVMAIKNDVAAIKTKVGA